MRVIPGIRINLLLDQHTDDVMSGFQPIAVIRLMAAFDPLRTLE